MKFEVYEELEAVEEPVVRLALRYAPGDGSVFLIAVDEAGKRIIQGYLLEITPEGRVSLLDSVSPDLGLPLDCRGRLIVEEE